MLELAITIVLVWVVGPLVVVLCAMEPLAALAVLATVGVTVGLVWAATALFGPAVGLACLILLFAGWKYGEWRGERGYDVDKRFGAWVRSVARETPTHEVVVGVAVALVLVAVAHFLWEAFRDQPAPLLAVLRVLLAVLRVAVAGRNVSLFVRTELRPRDRQKPAG